MSSKKQLNLIIQPTLETKDLSLSEKLDLFDLNTKLTELSSKYNITKIEISGGEVGLFSDTYQELLYQLCSTYVKKINVYSNLEVINKALFSDKIDLYFWYKPTSTLTSIFKEKIQAISSNKVINAKTYDKDCNDSILKPLEVINQLNQLNIRSWEIKPFLPINEVLAQYYSNTFFEGTVLKYIPLLKNMQFSFLNKLQIDGIQNLNNYNTTTIVINPKGQYVLPIYDNNVLIYKVFVDIYALDKAIETVGRNIDSYCKTCSLKLKCLAQIINPNSIDDSCSGFKNLLK